MTEQLNTRALAVSVLQMYWVARQEGIDDVDLVEHLEAYMEFGAKGFEWCIRRGYLKDGRLTKRGLRFVKKETDDYQAIKEIMLRQLKEEAKE